MDVQLIPPRLTVTRQKGARNDCSGTKSLGQPGKMVMCTHIMRGSSNIDMKNFSLPAQIWWKHVHKLYRPHSLVSHSMIHPVVGVLSENRIHVVIARSTMMTVVLKFSLYQLDVVEEMQNRSYLRWLKRCININKLWKMENSPKSKHVRCVQIVIYLNFE